MCNLTDNFMEDALFHQQLKAEYEHRMWCEYMEQKEAEEKAYLTQAEQYFKDLKEFEITQMEKEYKAIKEWEDLQTV